MLVKDAALFSKNVQTGSGAHSAPQYPEVKRPRREVDYLTPSNAEFKNEWMYTSTPLIRLHGMGRDITMR